MDTPPVNLTEQLITKINNSHPLRDPANRAFAIQGIVDYFAVSFCARHHPDSQKLRKWLTLEGGNTVSWLVGQSQQSTARQAALFNGFQAHLLDYDDVHAEVRGHPSAVILSALFASLSLVSSPSRSEAIVPLTSDRFIAAYIIGIELMAHLGHAVGGDHYQKGWHNTATLGGIAATAAICYLHNFPFMKSALAIAATKASGLRLLFGSVIKPLHAGMAAQTAIEACQWSLAGLHTDSDLLAEKRGFLAVYGQGNQRWDLATWGKPWRISGLWFKNYPYCSAASYVADATKLLYQQLLEQQLLEQKLLDQRSLDYRRLDQTLFHPQHNFTATDIEHIDLIFSTQGDDALIYRQITQVAQGRFSAEFIVASILLNRPLTFATFAEPTDDPLKNNLVDDSLKSLMAKITRSYDKNSTTRYAKVIIHLQNGQQLAQQIEHPQGSPKNPYSPQQLQDKFFTALEDKKLAKAVYKRLMQFHTSCHVNHIIEPLSQLFTQQITSI